jgi:predicted SnoaL-like aldol condensation-catalyzing enzyme
MNKKEAAIDFLQLAGTGKVKEAYSKYIASDFIHHNQYFKSDRQSLLEAMEQAHQMSPNKTIEVKHCYQDEDTIITHSCVVRGNPLDQNIAVVHIFRFSGDKVVELWDLGQMMEKNMPNERGMF